jgi:hypothetical protein
VIRNTQTLAFLSSMNMTASVMRARKQLMHLPRIVFEAATTAIPPVRASISRRAKQGPLCATVSQAAKEIL